MVYQPEITVQKTDIRGAGGIMGQSNSLRIVEEIGRGWLRFCFSPTMFCMPSSGNAEASLLLMTTKPVPLSIHSRAVRERESARCSFGFFETQRAAAPSFIWTSSGMLPAVHRMVNRSPE